MKAAIAAYKEKVAALEENNEILEKKNKYTILTLKKTSKVRSKNIVDCDSTV